MALFDRHPERVQMDRTEDKDARIRSQASENLKVLVSSTARETNDPHLTVLNWDSKSRPRQRPLILVRLPTSRRTGAGHSCTSVGVARIWPSRAMIGCL